MDTEEIEKQIEAMDSDNKNQANDESDFSVPDQIDDDDEGSNKFNKKATNQATGAFGSGKNVNRKRGIGVDDIKVEGLGDAAGPLEIDENQMKTSVKSEYHTLPKGKSKNTLKAFSGIEDIHNVKQSFDKVNNSRTDDKLLTKSRFTKNPKLEQTKDADILNIDSVEFNSNADDSKTSGSNSID